MGIEIQYVHSTATQFIDSGFIALRAKCILNNSRYDGVYIKKHFLLIIQCWSKKMEINLHS